MCQFVDDAERYTDLPAGRRDPGKLAYLPANKLCLKAGLILGNQQILQTSSGFEDPMVQGVL
jgi:hypothetical protein